MASRLKSQASGDPSRLGRTTQARRKFTTGTKHSQSSHLEGAVIAPRHCTVEDGNDDDDDSINETYPEEDVEQVGIYDGEEASANVEFEDESELMEGGEFDLEKSTLASSLLETSVTSVGRPGRKKGTFVPKQAIWDKFIIKKLPNGKRHAQCPRCKHVWIRAKVERLETHLRKKCGMHSNTDINTLRKRIKRSHMSAKKDREKVLVQIRQSEETSILPSDPAEDENAEANSILDHDSDNVEGSKSTRTKGAVGRATDPVWQYFHVTQVDGKKVVTCKKCMNTVSGKVERTRVHFIKCHGLHEEDPEEIDAATSETKFDANASI